MDLTWFALLLETRPVAVAVAFTLFVLGLVHLGDRLGAMRKPDPGQGEGSGWSVGVSSGWGGFGRGSDGCGGGDGAGDGGGDGGGD